MDTLKCLFTAVPKALDFLLITRYNHQYYLETGSDLSHLQPVETLAHAQRECGPVIDQLYKNIDGKYLTFGVIDIPAEVRHSLSSEMSCRKCSSRD